MGNLKIHLIVCPESHGEMEVGGDAMEWDGWVHDDNYFSQFLCFIAWSQQAIEGHGDKACL